ncbi:MAG: CheR family methyltransferase [Methylomonas sp.]
MLPPDKYPGEFDGETANLTDIDFQTIQQFLIRSCGIVLSEHKQYLVKSRLLSLLGKFEIRTFAELAATLQSNAPSGLKLKNAVIDAMTTNETSWFRDEKQFVELKEKIFPELFSQKNGTIKIWSAACSSGQEPYSISISALEALRAHDKNKTVQIIGTDISETILLEAKNAVYSELALSRGIDLATKARYFQKNYNGYGLVSEVTSLVRFQQFNLLKPFAALGRFDIIFCRNVLIYFSEQIKRDILTRMADCLEPGGYLFLSSTEALPGGLQCFEPVHTGSTSYFKKAEPN